jgi:hypothetical protein
MRTTKITAALAALAAPCAGALQLDVNDKSKTPKIPTAGADLMALDSFDQECCQHYRI